MLRNTFLFLSLALVLMSAALVAAQDAEPLKIGLLTDKSGPLTIYGIELEQGFKLVP